MYKIQPSYYPMMESILIAIEEKNTKRCHAAMAWWLGQNKLNNEDDFWLKVAGKITSELSSDDKEALSAQLLGDEMKFVLEPVAQYPELPASLASTVASWDPLVEEPDLDRLRADAVLKVDRAAEAYRLNFITAGSGQTMAYQQKLEEARAKIANASIPNASIPHIIAEAEVDGVTPKEKAEQIVATFEAWQQVSAQIEAKRMTAKKNIAAAENPQDIRIASEVSWSGPLHPDHEE